MTEEPTPGQVACEAYRQATIHAIPRVLPYERLTETQQRAWEAAAQAVIDRS